MNNRRNYYKEYYIRNKERINKRNRKYYQSNKEKLLEQKKQYYASHVESELKRYRQYYKENKEHRNECSKNYYQDNRKEMSARHREWRINNPERTREISMKHTNKRERNLGFKSLNKYFKGAMAHHIDRIHVVYIPKELHEGISHCLETGQNMEKINEIAINFLRRGVIVR